MWLSLWIDTLLVAVVASVVLASDPQREHGTHLIRGRGQRNGCNVRQRMSLRGGQSSQYIRPNWQGLLKWSLENQKTYEQYLKNGTKPRMMSPEDAEFLRNAMELHLVDGKHMIQCCLLSLRLNHKWKPSLNIQRPSEGIRFHKEENTFIIVPRRHEWGILHSPFEALLKLKDYMETVELSKEFVELGGLNVVNAWILEAPDDDHVLEAVSAISLACHNNPVGSRRAVKHSIVESLFSLLTKPVRLGLKRRALMALSSIALMDPEATLRFSNCRGFQLIAEIFYTAEDCMQKSILNFLISATTVTKMYCAGKLLVSSGIVEALCDAAVDHRDKEIRMNSLAVLMNIAKSGKEELVAVRGTGIVSRLLRIPRHSEAEMDAKMEFAQVLLEKSEEGIDTAAGQEFVAL